jgi:predicted nucleic acid-binding protein
LRPEEESKRQAFIKAMTLVPFSTAIQDETAAIRRATRLKLPDAAIAATAVKLEAVLLTEDDHFDGLDWPGLTVTDDL